MRKIISSCLCVTITFFNSCKKEEEKNAMDFKLTGIANTSVILSQSREVNLKVFFLGGNKEEVNITAEGIPSGISISFNPVNGEPDFSLTETIHADVLADTGVFPITITGTSVDNHKTFSKTFNLTVLPIPNSLPVISLIGGTNIISILNAPYADSGYVAYDAEDGNITANVIMYGAVNKDSAGTYRISYVVYDAAGDKDSVVRTVRIKNEAEFMSGSYTCTPNQPPGLCQCLTNIIISPSVNKKVVCANGINCYTANLFFDIQQPDKVFLNTQSSFFQGTSHTYSGQGTYSVTGSSVLINVSYTDDFIDTLGNNISINRSETYFKL